MIGFGFSIGPMALQPAGGPPADTTAPVLSNVLAKCGVAGLFQGGSWDTDEPAQFRWRYGYKVGGIPTRLGTWSAWTGTYETTKSVWMNTTYQMASGEYFKFEVEAQDAAGNTSSASAYFMLNLDGTCP